MQWQVCTTIQRETKWYLADCKEETAELSFALNDLNDYAELIIAYRKKYKIKQKDLAQILGVNPYTLRSWEQKNAKPPYHIWRQFKTLFYHSDFIL